MTTQTTNERVLATVKIDRHVIARFNEAMKAAQANWSIKLCGHKPTPEMLMVGHLLASKKNSVKQAGFVAMNLRDGGCSVQQHGMAFAMLINGVLTASGPARNERSKLVNDLKYFKGTLIGGQYSLEFTKAGEAALAKGLASLQAIDEAAGEPKPPKAPRKAKGAPKVDPAATPQVDSVDAPVAAPEAVQADASVKA